jgi:LAGLIDADG DNA endonuclease family.
LLDFSKFDPDFKKKTKFSNEYRKNYKLTIEQEEALIGIMLGDGYLARVKSTHNTRLQIEQAYPKKEDYLLSLFYLFKPLVISNPAIVVRKIDKRTGKYYKSIKFRTSSMGCLNKYHDLFYKNRIKIVPKNIHELLMAIGLAYWIMDDGSKTFYNQTILHTRAFSKEEVVLLQNALNTKFKLKTRIVEKGDN